MANYRMSIQANIPQAQLFRYMATFSNAAEWDPGVASAIEENPGEVALGSVYTLEIKLRNRTTPFQYKIIEFDSPHRVVLEATTKTFYSRDIITVRQIDENSSELNYEATLRMRGFAAILNSLLYFPFRRIGNRARQSLKAILKSR